MRALILAGGFGTRLSARLPGVPKVLAPVAGRPFLAHQLDWLAAQGIEEAIVAVHHLADQVVAFVDGLNGGTIPVRVLREDRPLGTGGAVAHAFPVFGPEEDVLVVNGDTHFGFSIGPLLERHKADRAIATIAVAEIADSARYGTVEIAGGKIVSFRQATGSHVPGMVSTGAALLKPRALARAPAAPFSLETDLFPKLAAAGQLHAHIVSGEHAFTDIGTADSYDAFVTKKTQTSRDRAAPPENVRSQLIPADADLRGAMVALRASGRGIVFVEDEARRIVGVLTDGDARNAVLERGGTSAPVADHMTRDFVFVYDGTPKEQVLRLLDSRIKVIPILDRAHRLVDVVGTGYVQTETTQIFARARAPVRLSLAGGGTDFTSFFMRHGGISLTSTLARYCHATLRKRGDRRVSIYSHDLRARIEAESADALCYDGTLDLIKAGIKVLRPEFGFDLEIGSDFPPGSGLGGSASILAAAIGCLNEFREDKLDNYTIAECAFEAERVELGIAGGWQDQYATVFGGFNYIEFDREHNTVTPLRLDPVTVAELEERLLLCYTGRGHLGAAIQVKNHQTHPDDVAAAKFAEDVKAIAATMKSRLLRGKLDDFGQLLDETWRLKKSFRAEVSNDVIDAIYRTARAAGAEGGRLLGTGGGGYFVFFVPPFARFRVARALEEMGLATENVVLEHEGLKSWTARA